MNHTHVLYDSDPHFKIDPISRRISNESSRKTILIQHDHNSERFTFEIPRQVEGHDMSNCNLVEIHYVNAGTNNVVRGGVYTIDDLQVKSDNDDVVVFSWIIPNNATQYVGQLHFLVRFSCVNDSTGKVEYVWNTGIYTGISVSSGIYNSDSPSDNPVPAYNFVTTVDGSMLKFYVGSEGEYNKLVESGVILPNCLYVIADENSTDDVDVQVEALKDTVNGIMSGLQAVQKAVHASTADTADTANSATNAETASTATNVEHLYLHTATIIVNDIATDGVKIIFSVSYTDTSENKKDIHWYSNQIVYKGSKICAPVTAVQAGTRTAYDWVEFSGSSGAAYGANLYNAYDGSSKGVQVTSVKAIIADPIQIR